MIEQDVDDLARILAGSDALCRGAHRRRHHQHHAASCDGAFRDQMISIAGSLSGGLSTGLDCNEYARVQREASNLPAMINTKQRVSAQRAEARLAL
jgi:hypothetical protein